MPTTTFRDVRVQLFAGCRTCKSSSGKRGIKHEYNVAPTALDQAMADWETKHPASRGCQTLYWTPKRKIPKGLDDRQYSKAGRAPWFLDYAHNTDFKIAYAASAAVTNAIESLATSSTWLAGYESATIDNSSNKYLDIWLSGKTTVGTTPTINTVIEHNIVSMIDDSTWPDVFDGTTSAETITSQGVKDGICIPLVYLNVDATTSDRAYPYGRRSVAALFGGLCPPKFAVFTTHNTGVNLNATGSNQVLTQTGAYITGT